MGTNWDDGGHQKIEKIIIGRRGSIISSIRAVYSDPDGTKVVGPEHGGKSLTSVKMVILCFQLLFSFLMFFF